MLDKLSLKPVLESLIFAADSAISFDKLASVLEGEERAIIKEALAELVEDYRTKAGGFLLEEVANGFQFRTNPEFAPWLRKFFKIGMQKISKAAMESLAVIAYKQPVTRGEIEAIRGVDSGGVLATLMEKRFIKIVGRKEVPGRPVVYGTTKEFLETFDLKDLSCLPTLKDIQKMEEEYAQKEGQGTAETTGEDPVQGAEDAQGRVEDEVQESIQDGTGRVEGEDLQASAEDWEETDPDEAGGEPGEASGGPDLEERDREGDPDAEGEVWGEADSEAGGPSFEERRTAKGTPSVGTGETGEGGVPAEAGADEGDREGDPDTETQGEVEAEADGAADGSSGEDPEDNRGGRGDLPA